MKILLILIALMIVKTVLADESRARYSFKSKNEYFELRPSDTIFFDKKNYKDSIYDYKTKGYITYSYNHPKDRYYWGLYDLRNNKKLYTIRNDSLYIETKTALISENGESIIIVDDYSDEYVNLNPDVVHFYKKEKLVKTLRLSSLLQDICIVSYSVSHMTWCFDFGLLNDSSFQIKTYDYYNYRFDLNGTLIEKKSDKRIQSNDDIVLAKIKRLKKDTYSFTIRKSIRTKYEPNEKLVLNVSDKLMRKIHGKFYGFFPSRNKKMETEFHQTFLMRDDKPIHTEFGFPIYNANFPCNMLNKEVDKN